MADGKSVGERREQKWYGGSPRVPGSPASRKWLLHTMFETKRDYMPQAVRETPKVLMEAATEKGLEEGRKPSRLRKGLEKAKR